MDYLFKACSIEEFKTAAGLMEDSDRAWITGEQMKIAVPLIAELSDDLDACHALCDQLDIPKLGGGTKGLMKRLKFLVDNNGSF